jgi:hypothetical protein
LMFFDIDRPLPAFRSRQFLNRDSGNWTVNCLSVFVSAESKIIEASPVYYLSSLAFTLK